MDETETENDSISLEDTLKNLKRNATAVEVHLQESIKYVKRLKKQIAEESKDISQVPLQPKTRMMKWLTERGLPVESTFQEFFEAFLEEHRKDHRLDVSNQTIRLNSAACVLLGMKDCNPVLHLYAFLEKLPILYE
jgi:hypothetical protein